VYDITNPESFDGLVKWHKELVSNVDGVIIAICGNKEDQVDSEDPVTLERAQDYTRQIGALYRKTSAKTSYGVEQLFVDLAEAVIPVIGKAHRDS
jgi:GTPase SAR1 family protein